MKKQVLGLALLVLALFCGPVQATHIHFEEYGDTNFTAESIENGTFSSDGNIWSHTFKLTQDIMSLWDIDTAHPQANTLFDPQLMYTGRYDPAAALHYVTLRIDPNMIPNPGSGPNSSGNILASTAISLEVNGQTIAGWFDPIRLFDWKTPEGQLEDNYLIIPPTYEINVVLTGLNDLPTTHQLSNVNIEGCFDQAAPVPEPSTLLLLGGGLIGLAGWKRRQSQRRDG